MIAKNTNIKIGKKNSTKKTIAKKTVVKQTKPNLRKIKEVSFVKSFYNVGLEVFKEYINNAIEDGWQPVGTPFIYSPKLANYLVQEVVKYEDD